MIYCDKPRPRYRYTVFIRVRHLPRFGIRRITTGSVAAVILIITVRRARRTRFPRDRRHTCATLTATTVVVRRGVEERRTGDSRRGFPDFRTDSSGGTLIERIEVRNACTVVERLTVSEFFYFFKFVSTLIIHESHVKT